MKLAALPSEVITDLSDRDRWRLDVDYDFDAKHEFFLSWNSFAIEIMFSPLVSDRQT